MAPYPIMILYAQQGREIIFRNPVKEILDEIPWKGKRKIAEGIHRLRTGASFFTESLLFQPLPSAP